MKKQWISIFSMAAICITAFAATPDFSRYQVILDRKPFGEPPPPEPENTVIPLSQSFAKDLRMSALLEDDEGGMRIGLINLKNNSSFFLSEGQTEEGIELVEANYDKEEAVIRKGSEMAVIKLQSGTFKPLNAAEQKARLNAPKSHRMSYAERRAARRRARENTPPPEPKYKGEELERHLHDYQMDVIRQGLPPLPIPLTQEMDDQLVREGVLPPVE